MRVHNFGAGPSALPQSVLERVRDELLDYSGSGRSILESSHRGAEYAQVHRSAGQRLRRLLGGAEEFEILFMGGGARTQFSAVPMNLLTPGREAGYLVTGRWSELALAAAEQVGLALALWTSKDASYDRVPSTGEEQIDPNLAYLHYTSNNTIYGTQYAGAPASGAVPLVCDMSSDILSRPLDLAPFGLIYAGAQKNLGPAGVTVVIVRKDLVESAEDPMPDTLSYRRMAAKDSLLNTPPVFAIYVMDLVLEGLERAGGLRVVGEANRAKAARIYSLIDNTEFYRGHAQPASRSLMNVTFRLPNEELEAAFVQQAEGEGLVGLRGHRSVGGIRASIYNSVELGAVEALAQFMAEFERRYG